MELNFNSVEMSSKPNAEASLLDYAEAPLTFNSVETITVLNALSAFKTDSGKVFKEDVDIVPGKSQSNNSGSDKRELYTIAQALQKPYHDLPFTVHQIVIRFNGWTGCTVDVPLRM